MVELGLKAGFIEQSLIDQAFPDGLPANGTQVAVICRGSDSANQSFFGNKLGLLSAVLRRK